MPSRKEHVPIREVQPCSEPGCDSAACRRGLCWKHYCRLRYWAIKQGEWEPQPSGNFGDAEGHRLSAKMGGAERAKDREGLSEAGRLGYAALMRSNPNAREELEAARDRWMAANPATMSENGRRGHEAMQRKRAERSKRDHGE